jgi:hypothetical protein
MEYNEEALRSLVEGTKTLVVGCETLLTHMQTMTRILQRGHKLTPAELHRLQTELTEHLGYLAEGRAASDEALADDGSSGQPAAG